MTSAGSRRARRSAVRHTLCQRHAREEASEAALARRQIETAEQIVAVLATMKGAAMKLAR